MSEYILLKWGTLKGWDVSGNEAALAALRKYHEAPVSMSVMTQHDTDEQKQAICELIDVLNGEITNDWSGERLTKDQAKDYVLNYGKDAS